MTEVIVTGASGFIGSHLVPTLRARGHAVRAIDRSAGDVADPATWLTLPHADVLVHLAARSFVPDSWLAPASFMRTNLLGTIEALEFCRRHGARLVFLSSYMYGEPERLPIDETAPVIAPNPYALSKKLAEDACRFYAENYDTSVTVFRPFNVYGPGQAEPFLVPFIARQIREGQEIRVKDLAPRRDYVYVQDVVDGIVSGAEQGVGYQLFNLGSGQSYSVEELIAAMQLLSGSALPVSTAGERRPEEIMDTVADISAAQRAFGWTPGYSLRDGLALTLAGAERVRG